MAKSAECIFEKFMSLVRKDDKGCWIWTGRRRVRPTGQVSYGRIMDRGREWLAHRLSWTLFQGEIPAGKCVCHRCDDPRCVNPVHLFLGTHKENMHDCMRKRRHHHGVRHRSAKLKPDQIETILRAHADGVSISVLAERFGVKAPSIRKVVTGQTWKQLREAA